MVDLWWKTSSNWMIWGSRISGNHPNDLPIVMSGWHHCTNNVMFQSWMNGSWPVFFFHQNENIQIGASPLVILQLFAMGLLAHLNRSSSCSSTVMVISSVCEKKKHREKRGDGMGKRSVAWDGWHAATRFICCVKHYHLGVSIMGVPHIEWFLLGKIPLTVTYIYIYQHAWWLGVPLWPYDSGNPHFSVA